MNFKNIILFLFVLFISFQFSLSVKSKRTNNNLKYELDSGIIITKDGAIRGINKEKHRVWYGIPYARPPIDELRYQNPRPVRPWRYIRDGTIQRDQCIQNCELGNADCSYIGTSEDCLYLDVFVPIDIDTTKKASVLVFIPGGVFNQGTGSCPLYDASHFANSSVIVVNINYRLGALGFLGTDILSGNFGFMDQIAALEWVHKNIHLFGGNNQSVTLYGQSAGGLSVIAHLVSEYSRGYFHRAIISSVPLTVGLKTSSQARGFANRFSNKIGCNIEDMECHRSKSPYQIMKAQKEVEIGIGNSLLERLTLWAPAIDNNIIPGQLLTSIRDNNVYHVPLIIGDVQDEAILFVYSIFKKDLYPIIYKSILRTLFGSNQEVVLAEYPAAPKGHDCRRILSRLLNDYLFRCSARYFVNKQVENISTNVYHYNYKFINSGDVSFQHCEGLVCHGQELSIVFNTYSTALDMDLEQDEVEIAHSLSNYWVNFINTGNPNKGENGLPVPSNWNPMSKTKNNSLIIDIDIHQRDITTFDTKCDLFDRIGYRTFTKVPTRNK